MSSHFLCAVMEGLNKLISNAAREIDKRNKFATFGIKEIRQTFYGFINEVFPKHLVDNHDGKIS